MAIRNNPKFAIKKRPPRSLTMKDRAIAVLTETEEGVDEHIYEFILYAVRKVDGEDAAREIQDMVEGHESKPPRSSKTVEKMQESEDSFGGILNNPRNRGRPPGRKTTRKPVRK